MKCECKEKGILRAGIADMYDEETELPFVNHEPSKCECKNKLKQYLRNGKKIWLCSNCNLTGDIEL